MAAAPAPYLPPAMDAERCEFGSSVGLVSYYRSVPVLPTGAAPLLLVHSVNAAASAAEVAPLFEHYRKTRSVYAIDLPGYGFSDRSDRVYSPRLMTDALLALLAIVQREHDGATVDLLGVSLSVEFVARAQREAPQAIRRVALVSPTGFSGTRRRYGPPESTLGVPGLYRFLTRPLWSDAIYNTLTRPGVIRYFLQRTWGSRQIDEALWRYDVLTTRQPGAKHAPLYFVSAFLFSKDINRLYEAMDCPVWVSMATRGDFTDYRGRDTLGGRSNWQFHLVEGGALPYFEKPDRFTSLLDAFLDTP